MTLIEAAKLARDALGPTAPECSGCAVEWQIAINALDQAIAEAEQQEPFGYFRYDMRLDAWVQNRDGQRPGTPFYTTPPKREWQGLTDDEIALVNADYPHPQGFARAIEAKLKEKNT